MHVKVAYAQEKRERDATESKELKPKDRVLALWKPENDDWRECEIISKKTGEDGVLMYYVHWSDFNRRNDSWVPTHLVNHQTTRVCVCSVCVGIRFFSCGYVFFARGVYGISTCFPRKLTNLSSQEMLRENKARTDANKDDWAHEVLSACQP